jgi:hypothetical protein
MLKALDAQGGCSAAIDWIPLADAHRSACRRAAPIGLVLRIEIFRMIPPLRDLTLPPDGVSFWSTPPIENLKTT